MTALEELFFQVHLACLLASRDGEVPAPVLAKLVIRADQETKKLLARRADESK